MALSYAQKRHLIDFLTQPAHWQNAFDMDFIMRKERRWKQTNVRGVKILRSDDGAQSIFYHKKSKASLRIHNMLEGTLIECDAGAHIFVRANGHIDKHDTQGLHGQILGDGETGYTDNTVSTLEIPGTSALIRFYDDGSKTIFFDQTAIKITYTPALKNEQPDTLRQGQFFSHDYTAFCTG